LKPPMVSGGWLLEAAQTYSTLSWPTKHLAYWRGSVKNMQKGEAANKGGGHLRDC
jgi:hypothetical protein